MITNADFRRQMAAQLRFLAASCREYDAGTVEEAVRIATTLRVLFYNTARSTSLLVHLQATSTPMLSTSGRRPSDNPRGYWPALIQIDVSPGDVTLKARPKFNATPGAHRTIPFAAWWDGEVVFVAADRRFKRRKLVTDAANTDGGAHVATSLPPDYSWMKNGADFSFGVRRTDGTTTETRLANAHYAYLRQIAHEALNSPHLLALAGV